MTLIEPMSTCAHAPLPYQTLGNASATNRLFGLSFNIRPKPRSSARLSRILGLCRRHMPCCVQFLGIILRLQGSSSCHSERKFAPAAESPFISAPIPCRALSVERFKANISSKSNEDRLEGRSDTLASGRRANLARQSKRASRYDERVDHTLALSR